MCSVPPPGDRSPKGPRLTGTVGKLALAGSLLLLVAFAALAQSARSAGTTSSPAAPTPTAMAAAVATAPELTPAPRTSRLSLESEPAGATVLVNGQERGTTPLVLEKLSPGSHQVKLSMEGRKEWQTELSLSPEESRQLAIVLEEIPAPTQQPTATPEPTATSESMATPEPTVTPEPALPSPIYPLAIMVENLVDARPQSGLARADLVYEALVEGGISRFMTLYVDGEADAIGPVRSARHYFVYLAAEHNASFVHIGSSPQGYEALSAVKITTLDETYGDPGFWRSRARYAPHNAYTSTDLVRSSLERVRRVTPGSLAGFRFRDDAAPAQGPEAPEISLVYPGGYRVRYVYSPEERVYHRYMEGLPHRDAGTEEQISPRNVVVQFVKAWVIDQVGRLDMEQVGEGRAVYFRDGVATEGYWLKPSYGNVTEWYDSDWKPVQMNPGKIWVQIVPPSGTLSY